MDRRRVIILILIGAIVATAVTLGIIFGPQLSDGNGGGGGG